MWSGLRLTVIGLFIQYKIMSLPLRIEYPGAWYHIMNRRRWGENIFLENMNDEIPESAILCPDLKRIKAEVCGFYNVKEDVLYTSRRGVNNDISE